MTRAQEPEGSRAQRCAAVGLLLVGVACSPARQVVDEAFRPTVPEPTWETATGPTVAIDTAHYNFHTSDGRYRHLAEILRLDGYRVESAERAFAREWLDRVDVLVIANALAERNRFVQDGDSDWSLPNPSAFTEAEIHVLFGWIEDGGALLLIADHMPFPGAAAALGEALGVRFDNGFAVEDSALTTEDDGTLSLERGVLEFRAAEGTLAAHPVTAGIDSIATFTGQAFRLDGQGIPLLVFPAGFVTLRPETAWVFTGDTPREDITGWLQGALLERGEGRVAVFGEAAMFTAQRTSGDAAPMGLNHPAAAENQKLVIQLLRWLSSALPDG